MSIWRLQMSDLEWDLDRISWPVCRTRTIPRSRWRLLGNWMSTGTTTIYQPPLGLDIGTSRLLSSDGLVTNEDTVLHSLLAWWTAVSASGPELAVLERLLYYLIAVLDHTLSIHIICDHVEMVLFCFFIKKIFLLYWFYWFWHTRSGYNKSLLYIHIL